MGVAAFLIEPPRAHGKEAVIDAMLALGGSAHIDAIVMQVEFQRRQQGVTDGPPVRTMVETALHEMREPQDKPYGEGRGRVYRPFGAASLRWSVCRDATKRPASVVHFGTGRRYDR